MQGCMLAGISMGMRRGEDLNGYGFFSIGHSSKKSIDQDKIGHYDPDRLTYPIIGPDDGFYDLL